MQSPMELTFAPIYAKQLHPESDCTAILQSIATAPQTSTLTMRSQVIYAKATQPNQGSLAC